MSRAYLIEGPAGLTLVDAGPPHFERVVLRKVAALGGKGLGLIYVTHAHGDHYGSAAALRRITGAPIAIHRADGEAMARGETPIGTARGRGRVMQALFRLLLPLFRPQPTPADLLLQDGDDLPSIGTQAVVLHTPGHTPGSSCLILERQIAFAGDLVSTTGGPHLQRYFAHNWSQIPHSLHRLQALAPERTYPGHGRHLLDGAALQGLTSE
jgi:glyoxylase-like metal-dependent hydrolase (beta-lactamase superfamily II)